MTSDDVQGIWLVLFAMLLGLLALVAFALFEPRVGPRPGRRCACGAWLPEGDWFGEVRLAQCHSCAAVTVLEERS